jgi:hypothetical protein
MVDVSIPGTGTQALSGSSQNQHRPATRGLATIAMLKVNFDAGRDHIAMFQPFVLDAVAHLDADLSAGDVRKEVLARHELALPLNTLGTILGRIRKAGYLRREGGRYFRTEKPLKVTDVQQERTRVEERQKLLAHRLCEAGAERGVEVGSTEDALAMILDFLRRYHVALAFSDPDVPPESPNEEAKGAGEHARTVTTARFLQETAVAGGDSAEILQEMLEGFVLQNTLLLKDIATATRRFRDLHVFMDSGLLFGALGWRGPADEAATQELVSLLVDTGAVLNVFEPTIKEMRRILTVYEDRVGTSAGRQSLHPTELTRHILSRRFTPSDIRMKSALLEKDLRALGFNIRELPARDPRWTLDERSLGKLLADGSAGGENQPRVVHDIDCVAGVLTYRRGKTTDSLDDARAVFVATSPRTINNIERWYKDQGLDGLPPIIHYLALSNRAWLKRPASATKLKLHELIALCVAAQRPSRAGWERFVAHLRQLEESGELSSDEVTAMVASNLTDRVLVDENIDEDSDASSVSEVVERVKASYKEVADAELAEARRTAERKASEVLEIRSHITFRARTFARACSWAVAAIPALAFVVGTVASLITTASGKTPSIAVLALAIIPLALGGLFGILWGFHLKAWRQSAEEWLAQRLGDWLAGS